jgi:hypothetical protein
MRKPSHQLEFAEAAEKSVTAFKPVSSPASERTPKWRAAFDLEMEVLRIGSQR